MSNHCEEVIDLTVSEYSHNNPLYLTNDYIILVEGSDSSFIEEGKNSPQKRKTLDKKVDSKKKKRLTVVETPEKKIGECPICCEQLGKKPVSSTKCGHVFCLQCINTSLKHNKKCPQCRQVLKGASAVHPIFLPLK